MTIGLRCPKCNDPLEFTDDGALRHEDGTEVCRPMMIPVVPPIRPATPRGNWICHHRRLGRSCAACRKPGVGVRGTVELDPASAPAKGEAPGADRRLPFPWAVLLVLVGLLGWAVLMIGYVAFGWGTEWL